MSQRFLPQSNAQSQLKAVPCTDDTLQTAASVRPEQDIPLQLPAPVDADLQMLAAALAGHVKAGSKPDEQYLASAADRFQQILGQQFDDCAVASILEALAMFGYNPSPCQVDAAAASIGANLQVEGPQILAVHELHEAMKPLSPKVQAGVAAN
jgi:hypothetical protein